MKINNKTLDSLFEYHKDQVFKALYLFEDNNEFGYRHVGNAIGEIRGLAYVVIEVGFDYRYYLLLCKLENLYDEMVAMQCEHRVIKNNVMESCNLLDHIREGLR